MSDTLKLRETQRDAYRTLHSLADELDEHEKKLDKAKLSFSTTGAAAGIMTIVGLALTPVTFGASIGLAIAGGVIGGLSAAGNIGSIIADKVLTSKTMKKSQEKLTVLADEDKQVEALLPRLLARLNGEELEDLKKRVKSHQDINQETKNKLCGLINSGLKFVQEDGSTLSNAVRIGRSASDVAETAITLFIALSKTCDTAKALGGMAAGAGATANVANAGRAVGVVADAGIDVAKTAGKVGLSAAKIVGIATAGVGVGLDLGGIIFYSIKVHKQKPSEVAENIRNAANFLK